MEDNPIWSKWSHYRHVPSKENSTTIDAKICQLGTDTRWHFGKCPLSNHNLQSDPLDMRPVKATVFIKTPFRTNWHNFWDGKSNTTVLTHELLDAQDLRLVSNFYLIRAPWTRPSGHIFWNFTRISQENKMICLASKSSSVMKTLILDRVSILTVNYGRWPTNSNFDDSPSVVYLAVSGFRVPSWDSQKQSKYFFQTDTRLHFQLFDRWTRKVHDLKLKQLLANWFWANAMSKIKTNKNLFKNLWVMTLF